MSTAPDTQRIPDVVVVGAGYTGLMCAVDLARRTRGVGRWILGVLGKPESAGSRSKRRR